ncbi:MAG TPA: PqqD family protein [Mycobacteriales bacterium]|nr:PqqD family protein [Mycobacteriales bacterium]
MQRPAAEPDVLCHEEAGEAFLLHVPSGRYFGLNPTGLIVWKALSAGEDPLLAVRERWPGTSEDVCRTDVDNLLAALAHAGLTRSPEAAGGR